MKLNNPNQYVYAILSHFFVFTFLFSLCTWHVLL